MGLRETAQKLAHSGITKIAGNVAETILYKESTGESFPDPANPLYKVPTFTVYTVEGIVEYINSDESESMFSKTPPIDVRVMFATTSLSGIGFSSRDRMTVQSVSYLITEIDYSDPARATVTAFGRLES